MKSFTKLAVLLLTLALLCTSVFAITAFADEAATVSTNDNISREGVVSIYDAAEGLGTVSTGRLSATFYKLATSDETGRYTITNNAPETPASDAKSSSFVNMSYLDNVQLDHTSYLLASLRIGTNNSYLMDEEGNGLVSLQFVIRSTVVASTGNVYIVPVIAEDESVTWWLCDGNNVSTEGVTAYCEIDNDFTLDVVLETVEKDDGKRNYNLHMYVDGAYVGTSEWECAKAYTYTNQYRVSLTNSDYDDANFATKEESIWFENCAIDAVSGSSATNEIDLAYLFKDGAPATTDAWATWETILYSVYNADGTRTYEGSEIVCTDGSTDNKYASDDPFRTAMNSSSSAIVALKRDVTYKNKTTGASAGANLFSIPNAAVTKTIYFNGCTLLHAPYYDNAGVETATRGQMFHFTGTSARTINFDGGYNAFGVKGTLARSAYQQSMFRGPSSTTERLADCGVTLNFADITVNPGVVTVTSSGAGYFTDGMMGGATWNFVNSEYIGGNTSLTFNEEDAKNNVYHNVANVSFVNSNLNLSVRPDIQRTNVTFDGCEVYVGYTGGQGSETKAGSQTYGMFTTDASSSIYAKNTAFKAKTTTWNYYKSVDGTITSTTGAYHILGTNASATYIIDEGCSTSHSQTIRYSKNTYAPGVILYRDPTNSSNTYTRKIDLFANLTLASDITYNLYIPTWVYSTNHGPYFTIDDLTVNYADFTEDDIITLDDGSEYFVYKVDFPAHEAFNDKTLTFETQYQTSATLNVTNTLSITNYVNTVLTNANDSAEYAAAYGLMADLVDYVNASADYFNTTVSDEFAALATLANYTANANANETISGAEVNYSAVTGYIKGAYLNVEESNTKFVFVAGTADKVTLSYTSLTEGKVTKTFENCTENQALVLEMRAYDLNAVINISVNDGEATGTYDLAAYANSEEAADADDVLLEMYNYAVSAKTYKEALLAAAENN